MTEAEWLAATDPMPMLEFLQSCVNARKLQLFACGCLGTVKGRPFPFEVSKAIGYIEKYCDGLLSWNDASKRINRIQFKCDTIVVGTNEYRFEFPPLLEAVDDIAQLTVNYCSFIGTYHMRTTNLSLVGVLRDIYGNPFRPVILNTSWRTSTVVALANGIYEEKAFDRIPILADALQDAGCDNDDILNHCRQPGEHVRGCWCVDLILDKK